MKSQIFFIVIMLLIGNSAYAMYLTDSSGNLYDYDIMTNDSSLIGNSGIGAWFDIALNPVTSTLYGITGYKDFYAINTNDGSASYIGNVGSFINGLVFDNNGYLYGSGDRNLYTIDLNSGSSTFVSYTGYISSGDLAFDVADNLYMSAMGNGSGDLLVTIDVTTGRVSLIGNIGFSNVYGLGFSGSTLYGFTYGQKTLIINTDTGVGTNIADNSIKSYGSINNISPVPEPTTILLFGIGIIGLVRMSQQKNNIF